MCCEAHLTASMTSVKFQWRKRVFGASSLASIGREVFLLDCVKNGEHLFNMACVWRSMSLHVSALLLGSGDLIVRFVGATRVSRRRQNKKNNGGEVFIMQIYTKKKKKRVFSVGLAAAHRDFVWENKKQKDFCQAREVLTRACSDVGGLALTFDLAIVFAPPRPACGDPRLLRRRLRTVSCGTRTRNLLIRSRTPCPLSQEGTEEHVGSVKKPRSSFAKARARLRATNGYSSCAQFFADALVRFQFSMFADGVACVQERAHPDLNQRPADLQSAALMYPIATRLLSSVQPFLRHALQFPQAPCVVKHT